MIRCYHITIDLAWALRRTTAHLKGMLTNETGEVMSGWEVRRRLKEAQAKGYSVLPVCEHHNARGLCLGHDVTSEEIIP